MAILDLMATMRAFLRKKGLEELPVFSPPLPEVWAHPDVLFSLFTGTGRKIFFFQPWSSGAGGLSTRSGPSHPFLVVVWQPYEESLWATLGQFLVTTGEEYSLRPEEINVQGCAFPEWTLASQGAAWRITLTDCLIGEAYLVSRALGREVPRGAFVWALDLVKLADLLENLQAATPPLWQTTPWSDLKLWPVEAPFPDLDPIPTWVSLHDRLQSTAKPGVLWQEAFLAGAQAARCVEKTAAMGRQWADFAASCRREVAEFWRARASQWGIIPPEPGKSSSLGEGKRGKGTR